MQSKFNLFGVLYSSWSPSGLCSLSLLSIYQSSWMKEWHKKVLLHNKYFNHSKKCRRISCQRPLPLSSLVCLFHNKMGYFLPPLLVVQTESCLPDFSKIPTTSSQLHIYESLTCLGPSLSTNKINSPSFIFSSTWIFLSFVRMPLLKSTSEDHFTC